MSHPTYTGSCLCGGVQFRIQGALDRIQVCHCMQCRKAQGTAVGTNVPVHTDQFTLERGADLLTPFESSPGKQRVFCKMCGSPVYSKRTALPDTLRVRVGLINEDVDPGLQAHYFATDKALWWPVCGDAPQFEAGPGSRRIE